MSAFTASLVIEEVVPGRRWRLVQSLRYEAGAKGSGVLIEVPAGFETDGATIPTALRVFLAVWGTYGRAACIHDYLYGLIRAGDHAKSHLLGNVTMHRAFEGLEHQWGEPTTDPDIARAWADHEFRIAMLACGTRPTLAWLMWAVVRVFGKRHIQPPRAAGA